jgi:pilus assembly protein Flp/PilA
MLNSIKRIWRDRRGATVVEYGLIISLVILAIFASMSSAADSIIETWNYIENQVVV